MRTQSAEKNNKVRDFANSELVRRYKGYAGYLQALKDSGRKAAMVDVCGVKSDMQILLKKMNENERVLALEFFDINSFSLMDVIDKASKSERLMSWQYIDS